MSNNFRLILAFGSNQGDRETNFTVALKYLYKSDTTFGVLKQSKPILTSPFQNSLYDTQNQEDYLNFVCDIVTTLHPFYFYQHLIVPIEDQLGHVRTKKWAPRALDIDILLAAVNNQTEFNTCSPLIIDHESFSVPHKCLMNPERIVIQNMLKNELNLNTECIECHLKQILLVKN